MIPGTRPPPSLSASLPHLVTAQGVTLTWRPAIVTAETRLALARLLLAGTAHTITEGRS